MADDARCFSRLGRPHQPPLQMLMRHLLGVWMLDRLLGPERPNLELASAQVKKSSGQVPRQAT